MPLTSFGELNFGLLDARHEAEADERLLLEGYFDLHGAFRKVLDGQQFVVLGYKGSGKSALAQHIKLTSLRDPSLVARTITLNELSYAEFSSVVPGDHDWHARYARVWSLALLLQILDLFTKDEASPSANDPTFQAGLESLRVAGLLPAKRLADAIRDYVDLPLNPSSQDGLEPPARLAAISRLVDLVERHALMFQSRLQFLLIVDGTDEIFTGDPVLLEVVAALVEAANRLNGVLRSGAVRCKVVILCRTDLFTRLPGSNMNKVRSDLGITLDWFEHTGDRSTSALARLADRRARMVDSEITSVFTDYFPRRISRSSGQQPMLQMLLEYTRHTPRDFLQLLNAIRDIASARGTGTSTHRLSVDVIRRGLTRYSNQYFANEIQDELWGHLNQVERDTVVPILTSIGKPRFAKDEFLSIASENYPDIDPVHLLQVLFECSALGNIRDIVTPHGGVRPRYVLKYRNPEATLNLNDDLFVHKGWRHKLNIVDDGSRPEPDDSHDDRGTPGRETEDREDAPRRRRRSRKRASHNKAEGGRAEVVRLNVSRDAGNGVPGEASRQRRATRPEGPPAVQNPDPSEVR